MVQRTRLAVILLLAMMAGILSAQQSNFFPPKFVSEAILLLPQNWKQEYSPPEVMILIDIKADSTAKLVKILDNKAELEPLIIEFLDTSVVLPAFRDGFAVDANLSIKLRIVNDTPSGQTGQTTIDSLKIIDKAELSRWINKEMQIADQQKIFSSDADKSEIFAPQMMDTFYRTNFYMMGLNSRPYIILKDGFIQPARVYYNALNLQMLSNFRRVKTDENIVSFANEKYTLPAMCTDVYAGLGDYEYNFARVQLLKNHLMGIKDFYTEIGFLVQNGWWQEVISDQTSTRLFLSLPVLGTVLSFNLEKYDQNIPSTSLLSGFQNNDIYAIAHLQKSIYFKWQLPWLTLGWQSETETMKSSGIMNQQKYQTDQLQAYTSYKLPFADFTLAYQYNYNSDLTQVQQLFQYTRRPEHQSLLKLGKTIKHFEYNSQALLSEDGLDEGSLDLGYRSNLGTFGVYYNQYNGLNHISSGNYFYINNNEPFFPSIYAQKTMAMKYKLPVTEKDIQLNLAFGEKNFKVNSHEVIAYDDEYPKDENKVNLVVVKYNKDKNLLFGEAYLKVRKDFKYFDVQFEQTSQAIQYDKNVCEAPELQGQSRLMLIRELNHDNALTAGLNLTGHTDYFNADVQKNLIYGAMVADAFVGVKITDLFEFQLMMKNLGSNVLYGLSPHPRTFLATIHWFYLN